MKITEKRILTEMANKVYDLTRPMVRGDILTHEAIESICLCRRHEDHYQTVVSKVKRRLEDERGIGVWFEHGVGYRLLTEQEQLQVAPRRMKRARRQIRRGIKTLNVLPTDNLTNHQCKTRAVMIESMARVERDIKQASREQQVLLTPAARPERRPERRPMPKTQESPVVIAQAV